MFTKEQKDWAKKELTYIMKTGNKTRYNQLVSNPKELENMEYALLYVVQEKSKAYSLAKQGKDLSAFGWIKNNPELAQQSALLQHFFVDLTQISMLP